jgi:hypothetical protein
MTFVSYGQEYLDLNKNRDCELFIEKKDYDIQKRISEIESLVGSKVTVYHVSGKKNKIKLSYTGIVEMADYPKITDKSRASLITVRLTDKNGNKSAYFPMTNDKRYRIFATERMK